MSRKCTLTATRISIAPTSCCGRGLRSIFDSHHALDSCRHWPLFHPDLDLLKTHASQQQHDSGTWPQAASSYVRHLSPVAERGKTLSTNLLFRLRKGFQSAHVARSITRSVPSGFWILGPCFLIITTLVHFLFTPTMLLNITTLLQLQPSTHLPFYHAPTQDPHQGRRRCLDRCWRHHCHQ